MDNEDAIDPWDSLNGVYGTRVYGRAGLSPYFLVNPDSADSARANLRFAGDKGCPHGIKAQRTLPRPRITRERDDHGLSRSNLMVCQAMKIGLLGVVLAVVLPTVANAQ